MPLLLAAGALAATGRMNLALILGTAVLATLASDGSWYALGRRRSMGILHLLCRLSLEPDLCVRQTENLFSRRGSSALLVAKFIPGLSTVAPPLAGVTRMPLGRFVPFDGLGALLWIGVFIGLGALIAKELEGLAALLATMGAWLLTILAGGLGTYLLWKFLARQLFLRRLRVERITPEELQQKLESGEEVMIVVCATRWSLTLTPLPSQGRYAGMPGTSQTAILRCLETGRSFSTAADPTKRAAPGRRSLCDVEASRACGHFWGASRDGGSAASRCKRCKEADYSPLDLICSSGCRGAQVARWTGADEVKFNGARLDGAIPLAGLEARAATLPRGQEIIFYCG